MKTIFKTVAAIILIAATTSLYGFISSVSSLDIGDSVSAPMITVERSGYAIYRISTPLGSLRFNSLRTSETIDRVLSVFDTLSALLPNTAKVLSGKYSS